MRKLFAAIALAVGLGACVSMIMPMERLVNVPVSHRDGEAGVGAAIDRALQARGWVVTERRTGETDATLIGSEYRADITVRYSASAYSVVYRDSQGLDYDGQKIHRHYNNWLNNIRISIDRELIAAPPLAQP
jgi:hypothetical protein